MRDKIDEPTRYSLIVDCQELEISQLLGGGGY
jgi:hypothetical protein